MSFYIYDASKVQTIFRNGTGGSTSESSAASITFNFAPKVIIPVTCSSTTAKDGYICLNYTNVNSILLSDKVTTSYSVCWGGKTSSSTGTCNVKKSSDGKTIYWYSSYTVNDMSGYRYAFIGIS